MNKFRFYFSLTLFLVISNSKTEWNPKFEDEDLASIVNKEGAGSPAAIAALDRELKKMKLDPANIKPFKFDIDKVFEDDEQLDSLNKVFDEGYKSLEKLDKLTLDQDKENNSQTDQQSNENYKKEKKAQKLSWFSKIKNFIWKNSSQKDSSSSLGTCTLCKKVSRWCPVLGSYPLELSWIINDLKNDKVRRNRLLLYGNPGNGKTLIAQTIAYLTGSEFHSVDTPAVVHFVGDGPVAIQKEFLNAWKLVEGSIDKKVVIFFDEINNLATHTDKQGRSEHLAALTELWYHLDKYKDTNRIFIICATNSLDYFNSAFIDRFNYKIEIKDPDLNDRKELLKYYSDLYHASLSSEQINYIAENTGGSSRRSIEGLVDYLERWACNENRAIIADEMIESRLVDVKKDITNKFKSIENEKIENESKELQYKNLQLQIWQNKYLTKTSLILNSCSLITITYSLINWLRSKYPYAG